MSDKTNISVTYFVPDKKYEGEKFPILFEMLPYRKDDLFYARDRSLYDFFAKKGFLLVKADVRGTGSSEGRLPLIEYSKEEIKDAIEIIDSLEKHADGNARVGMWGISWSAFNSIIVAMNANRPNALKAILIAHGSDDLYHDDVHYVDGIFHMDEYMLDMTHEVALPNSNHFNIDRDFIQNRFNSYPWLLSYMKNQTDSHFWRQRSLRFAKDKLSIPIFAIGGILDSYRDTPVRLLTHSFETAFVFMGPYGHSWPDNGEPGPSYEWRNDAVAFWRKFLVPEKKYSEFKLKKFKYFLRDSYLPSLDQKDLPGWWCETDFPEFMNRKTFNESVLVSSRNAIENFIEFRSRPQTGSELGFYWGELTGKQKTANDEDSLSFISEPLNEDLHFNGIAELNFQFKTEKPQVNIIATLENIHPSGEVSLVTGAAQNSSQMIDRLKPKKLQKNKKYNLHLNLHHSSWTFRKGHRMLIRLRTAAFPMLWPLPYNSPVAFVKNSLKFNLPLLTDIEFKSCIDSKKEKLEKVDIVPRPELKNISENEALVAWPGNVSTKSEKSMFTYAGDGASEFSIDKLKVGMREGSSYSVEMNNPASSSYHGFMEHTYSGINDPFTLKTDVRIQSDEKYFEVTVKRILKNSNALTREKIFHEKIKRTFQ